MDLETELSRLLHARDTAAPAADPVPAVHSGMRRRRRQRRGQVLAAALSVLAVSIGGLLLVQETLHGSASQTPATQPPIEIPVAGPVAVTDMAVLGQQGFAVGSAPCSQGRCTALLVSSDGGVTWARRQARGLPATCSDTACATHLRFANDHVGYAYGLGLWVTTDAGRTWSTSPRVAVEALEISGNTAVRVVADKTSCRPTCRYLVQSAEVGSVLWHTTYGPDGLPGNGADLVRRGDRVGVTVHGNPAGGVIDERSAVLRSSDGGLSFTLDADPCSPPPFDASHESDTVDLTLGPDGTAVALCNPRGPGGAVGTRMSTDGGRTYGALRQLGTGVPERVVALSPRRLLVEVYTGSVFVLRLTDDSGATWTDVAQQEIGNSDQDVDRAVLRLSSATDGTWLLRDGSGYQRTNDGGSTWTDYPFVR